MKRFVVFCGSSTVEQHEYQQDAYLLDQTLAHEKMSLVYGGPLNKMVAWGFVKKGNLEMVLVDTSV